MINTSVHELTRTSANICDKASGGARISDDEAIELFSSGDFLMLGKTADRIRSRLHPEKIVTYIVDRNINYSNVCVAYCKFCAFYASPKSPDGYTLAKEELDQKIAELVGVGGIQILMQGGHNPYYPLEWYEDLLRYIKKNYKVHIHAFSPSEIIHFSELYGMPVKEVLVRLKEAGLDSIPGGGGEILVDSVRKALARNKASADEWIDVMRQWHNLGGKSTATMVIGHLENVRDRVEHLRRIRELQDETGGFTAFIMWTMQTKNTQIAHIPTAGGHEYLKTQAICRIYLDNIKNIQASWITQGDKIGQLALRFGANDMGGTMIEENVVSKSGTTYCITEQQIRALITDAGFIPKRRNCFYKLLE